MNHPSLQVLRDEHGAVSAVLRSLQLMLDRGPGDAPERFFDVMRAMLFYIDEFPERLHHPSESNLLFPRLARVRPDLLPVIAQLEAEHIQGEGRVRELQHLLLAWELIGDSRRPAFVQSIDEYVGFYLAHMRTEEQQILPAALQSLPPADWAELDAVIQAHRDPLASGAHDPGYDRLFTRIVLSAPAPVGVGAPLEKAVA
jgi:hemerythrin-like domain-containing protein